MARYNSVNATGSVAGGNSITTPYSGLLTTITSGGTITVPNPTYYAGAVQTFYNATGGSATLSSPSGTFVGVNASGLSTQVLASTAIITIVSDGTNYIVQDFLGGPVTATALTVSGAVTLNPANASISLQPTGTGTVTILPATIGTIDHVNIGATTKGSGAFTSLTANGVTTLTANTTVTLGTAASGALQVSGGVGIGGGLSVTGPNYIGGTTIIGNSSNSGLVGAATFINPGSPISVRQTFGTDGTGWQYRIAKNQSGAVTDYVTVQDNGYVGIGTITPQNLLQLSGTYPQLLINNPSSGSGSTMGFMDGGVFKQVIGHLTTTSALQFGVGGSNGNSTWNGSTMLTMNSNGISVGTSSVPTSLLQVVANSSNQGTGTSDNSYLATFDSYSTASAGIRLRQNGSNSYMSAFLAGTGGAGIYSTHSNFGIGVNSNVNVNSATGPVTTFTQCGLYTGPYVTYTGGSANGTQSSVWNYGSSIMPQDGSGLVTMIRNGIYGTPSGNTTTIMEFTLSYGWNGGWFELEVYAYGYYATASYRKYVVGGGYTMAVTEVTNPEFGFNPTFASCNFTRTGSFANGTRSTPQGTTDNSYYRYQIDLVCGAYVSAFVTVKTVPWYMVRADNTDSSYQIKLL